MHFPGKAMQRNVLFTQTKFCQLQTASASINHAQFIDIESIDNQGNIWEVTLEKKKYEENNCKHSYWGEFSQLDLSV